MKVNIIQFCLIVLTGSLIGWITNFLAIKMLFRPHKEIRLFFYKFQGLIPKRREEITSNIAVVIEEELLSISDIMNSLDISDIDEEIIENILNKVFTDKFKEKLIEKNPLFKMFINDSIISKIKKYIGKAILENKEVILAEIMSTVENKIDLKKIMIEKMNNFSLNDMEDIILRVSKNELKHIEIIGGILGGIIAIIQYVILHFFNL